MDIHVVIECHNLPMAGRCVKLNSIINNEEYYNVGCIVSSIIAAINVGEP